jgi:LuxR family maltose regulon positive regulatory protein
VTTTDPGATGLVLLGTKLHPPRRRRTLVARPRLSGLATRAGHAALTLVSAPAGFGKTTLIADWFADDRATAWVSLDRRDDDPTRFWSYVVAAMATVAPDLTTNTSTLLEVPQPSIEAVVTTLINELATTTRDLVLVLDDYHLIEAAEIHSSVAFLLEHLPAPLRLVIATRSDPPLPLATMRARGELLEVRAADLRFTAAEATSYLNGAMDLTLGAADIDVLEARTEGWIAALQLAALSMQGRADPAAFIAEFAGDDRFILDYLADEVLERQSPKVRDFLLNTSILARLTGPLCAAVTGDADARATLETLDRSNLFLVALDDRRTWYRYHHLFGDVLRSRLIGEHPDRVAQLHRRASDWYAANGDPHEAITHAMAGDDPARAAELIERVAPAMNRARQETQLRRWLEDLPDHLFADRPVLTMSLVGARMATGDPSGIEPLLASAASWIDGDGDGDTAPIVFDEDEYRRIPVMLGVYRAALALLAGDTDGTIVHASRALELVNDADPLQRGACSALLGLAHWSRGDLDTARDRYAESVACFERGDYLPDVMGCSLALADIQITQGLLGAAQRGFERALRHTTQQPGLRGAADMHAGLCTIAVEHNDLEAAAEHLRSSAELGEHMGLPQHAYRWRVATARLHYARGDLDAALVLLEEAEAFYATDFSPSVRPVSAMKARVQVELGDLEAGLQWAAIQQLAPDDTLRYVREFEHITLARVLLAQAPTTEDRGPLEQTIDLLGRLLAAAEEGKRAGASIEILVLLALAHRASGHNAEAAAAAQGALARAEPEGYVRTFLDAGAPMATVMRSLTGPGRERAERVLAAGSAADVGPRPRPAGPEELSDRELHVLRLLRGDLTGPEIARELMVSLNTFRTHTKHIYTKLGVTNRREAVSRAAVLGL